MIRDLSSFHFSYYFVANSFNCYLIYVLRSLAPLETSVIFVLSVLFMDPQRGIFYSIVSALLWDYVIALIMIIQMPFAEGVLRLTYYITFVTCFYSYYCYFACNFNLFALLN